ncbi:MAG: hypothetical protein U9Q84_09170 [Thermodesulfobacteriota bacterium]|nr:hypothetical protein [Thermodesulfobacteriota bacterium]
MMRWLLTGYAVSFNLRHHRHEHLFQNRYKSILCQKDPYLLELVRYIHLNPIRARVVSGLKELDRYPCSVYSRLIAKISDQWQDVDTVLALFAKQKYAARKKMRFTLIHSGKNYVDIQRRLLYFGWYRHSGQ